MTTSRRRRLTYVTQWFAPEPTAVPVWVAESLERHGWEVTVVTGIPNYPDGVVMDGYRAWRPTREVWDGLRLVRAPLYPSHDRSAIGRIANYVSWALSSAVVGRRALRGGDAVLVYSSPATAAWAAVWARLRHGTPYVLLVQDLWPDSIFASGFLNNSAARGSVGPLVNIFVRWTYRWASSIVVIAPGMRRVLLDRGVPPEKVHLVYNWVDEEIFRPTPASGRMRGALDIPPDVPLFLYAGNLGAAQGLEAVVDAFVELGDAGQLVLVGDGISRPELVRRAAGAPNIHFCGPMPVEAMTALQSDADVLVVSLSDHPLFEVTMPSKTQASLAAGRAVLAVAAGDVADVVERASAGTSARPGDPADVRRAVERLAAMTPAQRAQLGRNARSYYVAEMSQAVGGARLSALLETAAARHDDRPKAS